MKFTRLAFALLFTFFLLSCSDDKESAPITIVKEWHVIDVSVTGTGTTSLFGQPVTVNVTGDETDISYEITFSENPNNANDSGGYGMTFTASSGTGQTFTETYPSIDLFDGGTWALSENELIVTSSGIPVVYSISNFTSNTLTLTGDISRDIIVQGQTISMEIEVKYSMVY